MGQMITENYCDDVIHAVFDEDEFYSYKTGRIRCSCGCVVVPCNECVDENGQHYNCAECPWANAEIVDAMSDYGYVRWIRDNCPNTFKEFLTGNFGEYYRFIAEDIVNTEKIGE